MGRGRRTNFPWWPSAGTKRATRWGRPRREADPRRELPRPSPGVSPDPTDSPARPVRHCNPALALSSQPCRFPQPRLSFTGRRSQRGASFIYPLRGAGGRDPAPAPAPAGGVRGSRQGPRGRCLLWVSVKEIMAAGVRTMTPAPATPGALGVKQGRSNEAGKKPKREPPRLPETRSHPHPSFKTVCYWLNPLPISTSYP